MLTKSWKWYFFRDFSSLLWSFPSGPRFFGSSELLGGCCRPPLPRLSHWSLSSKLHIGKSHGGKCKVGCGGHCGAQLFFPGFLDPLEINGWGFPCASPLFHRLKLGFTGVWCESFTCYELLSWLNAQLSPESFEIAKSFP